MKKVKPLAKLIEAKMRADGYITVADVHNKTGHHVVTVHRWIGDGLVESELMGGKRWIKISSLIEKLGPDVAELVGLLPKRRGKAS